MVRTQEDASTALANLDARLNNITVVAKISPRAVIMARMPRILELLDMKDELGRAMYTAETLAAQVLLDEKGTPLVKAGTLRTYIFNYRRDERLRQSAIEGAQGKAAPTPASPPELAKPLRTPPPIATTAIVREPAAPPQASGLAGGMFREKVAQQDLPAAVTGGASGAVADYGGSL